jgi:hypothetical protein
MQIEIIKNKHSIIYGYIKGGIFIEHREGGPAYEDENHMKQWLFHGEFHREGGPAIEYANGDTVWYLYGKVHREDGPAINLFNQVGWRIEGKEVREEDFEEAVKKYKLEKICK